MRPCFAPPIPDCFPHLTYYPPPSPNILTCSPPPLWTTAKYGLWGQILFLHLPNHASCGRVCVIFTAVHTTRGSVALDGRCAYESQLIYSGTICCLHCDRKSVQKHHIHGPQAQDKCPLIAVPNVDAAHGGRQVHVSKTPLHSQKTRALISVEAAPICNTKPFI